MEFVKEESIYYLAKEVGRQVKFINTNELLSIEGDMLSPSIL